MFMLPDEVLDILLCNRCKNYLSARPVKVYRNRHILCGRCSTVDDDGAISIYDAVAEQGLFKCINRYEGCDRILRYPEVYDHERTCKSGEFKCPICRNINFVGGSLALRNHFKDCHRDSILASNTATINHVGTKFTGIFMYQKCDLLFMINVFIFQGVDHTQFIILNAYPLASTSISEKIYQKFILQTYTQGVYSNKFVTKNKLCSPFNKLKNRIIVSKYNLDNVGNLLISFELDIRNVQQLLTMPNFKMNVNGNSSASNDNSNPGCSKMEAAIQRVKFCATEEFRKLWSSKYKLNNDGTLISSLKRELGCCCHCQMLFLAQSINNGIYKCSCTQCSTSNNLLCSRCYFFGVKLCINSNGYSYEFVAEETEVFKSLTYYCHWGCGSTFHSWALSAHEVKCSSQRLSLCPIDKCESQLCGSELISHLQEHPNVTYHNENLIPTTVFRGADKGCIVVPVMSHFISITWEKLLEIVYSCSLYNIKNRSLGNYQPIAYMTTGVIITSSSNLFTFNIDEINSILISMVNTNS